MRTWNISKGKNEKMEGMLNTTQRRQDLHFDHWPVVAAEYGYGSTTSEECGFKYLLWPSQILSGKITSALSDPCRGTNSSKEHSMASCWQHFIWKIYINYWRPVFLSYKRLHELILKNSILLQYIYFSMQQMLHNICPRSFDQKN